MSIEGREGEALPQRNHVSDFLKCVQSRKAPITNEQIGGHSSYAVI